MKYSVQIDIDRNIDDVLRIVNIPENHFAWMEGLASHELLEGSLGQEGAKSKLKFEIGKRKMEMIEEIRRKSLPEHLDVVYLANGMNNIIKGRFEDLGGGKTRYIADNEFKLKGFMKVMGFFMKGAFKKQSMTHLQNYKRFIEEN